MRRRPNQRGKDDRALFTIKFESSSEESSDEDQPPPPPKPDPPVQRPPPSAPAKVVTQKVSAPPINFVTEYSEEEDETPVAVAKPEPPADQEPSSEVNEDVFTIQEDATGVETPTKPRPSPKPFPTRPVDASFPKRVISATKPDTSKTYVIEREKAGMMRHIYTIKQGQNELPFYGKVQKSTVQIYSDKQMKTTPEFVLMIGNEFRDFSLRKSTTDANEIMLLRFSNAKPPVDNARRLTVFMNAPKEGGPVKITSKNPRLNPDGLPVHDFGGRFAIDSVKNAALIASADGPPVTMIRKIGNEALEIDVKFPHEPIWAFAMGIASFLTKTK